MLDKAYNRLPTLRSRELRNNATDAECALWKLLKSRQLSGTRFNRQVPIGPFICDFVARTAKQIIELDGGQHAERIDEDAHRTQFLEKQGYRVIRFWNNDVLTNIEGVMVLIEGALIDRPSPSPSRSAGGGQES
jgi:very-short-patch-repair endonuclease